MKKPAGQEIKRKIDSKIFELQSSLLEEGSVTEALLEECVVYFRPTHLQDIVIERSEAESKCGWPVCGNALVLSRHLSSHSLAFGLSDEEEPCRFCSRACKAKTQALLSAIPSTPPYLRESVLRLVSPPPPSPALETEASGGQESSSKKAYKRPRRRDIPPSAKPATRVSGPRVVVGERGEGQPATIEKECPSPGVTGVASTVSEESGHASSAVESIDGDSVVVGETRASDVESLQAELGRVSISERACARLPAGTMLPSSSSALAAAWIKPSFAAQGEDEEPSIASAPTPPVLKMEEALENTAAALAAPPRPQDRPSSWEGMRFGRSSGAPSVVSLQASLTAEAAATATTIAAPANIDSYTVRAQVPAVATKSATASTNAGYPRVEQLEGRQSGDVGKFNAPPTKKSTARRKSVSFAEGTKDPPPPSITSARSSAPASGVAEKIGNRRGRGRGKGRDIASAGGRKKGTRRSVPATAAKPVVLGRVVERNPDHPTPMEMEASVVGRGKAGAIEGHVPTIEADISFSVLPKGYETGRPDPRVDNVDGGVEEKKSGDGLAVEGVKMGSLLDEEVAGEPIEEGGEDGSAHSLEEAQSVTEDNEDDDDNDRAIWREAFGSEMPPEVAEGPLIDMDTIHDKELREEFASSIGAFALLWSALSEWVTPDTRAVCRAGRAAAAANGATSAVRAAGQEPSTENPSKGATATTTTTPWSSDNLRARQASAVAAATEAEASRRVKGGLVGGAEAISSPNAAETAGPTVTGALRHSGLSAMVNMHLGQAERLLLRASPAAGAERPQKWTWSKEVDKARRCGRRRAEGGWLEEKEKQGPGDRVSLEEPRETEDQPNGRHPLPPPPPPPRETSAPRRVAVDDWTGKGGERDSFASPEPGCSAECRRALSAVIDTMDAGHASAAVNLSIAQWKVLPLVMLTAIGLGGGEGLRCGRDEALVAKEEAARGVDACARLGGAEAMMSAREFEMLMEVFREE